MCLLIDLLLCMIHRHDHAVAASEADEESLQSLAQIFREAVHGCLIKNVHLSEDILVILAHVWRGYCKSWPDPLLSHLLLRQ